MMGVFLIIDKSKLNSAINTLREYCDGSSPYADDETIERYVARVEQWGREHPKETRQSKFLKLFPDAPVVDGTILVCPKVIDNGWKQPCDRMDCHKCREKYWKEIY